ncbi:MAG: NAD-dependent epimerase/dehydratase family protein, partial [Planctomycetota bacterium]
MRNVLVTGGAGFIGSHLAEALTARGDAVTILDDFSSGKRANLGAWAKGIRVIEGSVCDAAAVKQASEGADVVFHQAAIPSVEHSFADPVATQRAIAFGTLQVLAAARDARIRRVVFASSSSVYGDSPELPKREDMEPGPLSPYAAS